MKTALTIAGSDSGGGAGIQADIKTFQAHGVFGMSAITAVTVQNTREVLDVMEMTPDIVSGQILCLFDDFAIDAVKIGMLSSPELVAAVAESLGKVDRPPVVLDPVMISKSGYALLKPESQKSLIRMMFPLADVVTPNIFEAEALIQASIKTLDEMKDAAKKIMELGAKCVVVKGGHLSGDTATDVVYDGVDFQFFEAEKIDSGNTHGTGCTFSSAVAANLALGVPFFEAVSNAKEYITGAIRNAPGLGGGSGPTHHFYDLYRKAGL